MATSSVKPTTRETSAYVRDKGLRAVLVTTHHGLIELRAKGLRSSYVLDVGSLYYQAVRQHVAKERAEKKAARKARRK
jgi:hypothetical protein